MEGSRDIPDGVDGVVHCGPVTLAVSAATAALRQRTQAVLETFGARWNAPGPFIHVRLHGTTDAAVLGEGRYLRCANTMVDKTASGLIATCRSGAFAVYDAAHRAWDLHIRTLSSAASPGRLDTPAAAARPQPPVWTGDSVEDLLELVLTTGWREAGWIPLHAGAVLTARRCALLTAPAKGGKTTLTVALLHRGWRTLGDDKALITLRADGSPEVRGLTSRFNIAPRTGTWFPELGDLASRPPISPWSDKRRVCITDVWQNCFADTATPTHIVLIQRSEERRATRIEGLKTTDVLSALLRQTVIPADAIAARTILDVLARTARSLRGVRFEIGDDAYSHPEALDALDERLE